MRTLCGHISLEIYVRTMSAQCPHNVRTMSAQHLPRETYVLREMLWGHSADIYLQGYMYAQCPHYILLRFSALLSDVTSCVFFRPGSGPSGSPGSFQQRKIRKFSSLHPRYTANSKSSLFPLLNIIPPLCPLPLFRSYL